MLRRVLTALGLILLLGCSRPLRGSESPIAETGDAPAVGTGSFDGQITSGDILYKYILHVPTGYQLGIALPLVINFHGYGSNADEEEKLSGMSDKADEAGFLVVYPQGIKNEWHDGPGPSGEKDVQFVRDLIAIIESQYSVDPKRIYATGISNGGGMANRVGCELADVIAAIAPVAGAYNFWEQCQPSRPVPVLAFHGLNDNIVPFDGTQSRVMTPPIAEWAAAWAERNGCDLAPAESTPMLGVTVQSWSGCREKAEVVLYVLAEHGHSWPGSSVMPRNITSYSINATDVMWEFFEQHPLP